MRARIIAAAATLLALAGCNEGEPTQHPEPKQGSLSSARFLGEVDGCRLWTVREAFSGREISFAKCGPTASTYTETGCGKGCTRRDVTTSGTGEDWQ